MSFSDQNHSKTVHLREYTASLQGAISSVTKICPNVKSISYLIEGLCSLGYFKLSLLCLSKIYYIHLFYYFFQIDTTFLCLFASLDFSLLTYISLSLTGDRLVLRVTFLCFISILPAICQLFSFCTVSPGFYFISPRFSIPVDCQQARPAHFHFNQVVTCKLLKYV